MTTTVTPASQLFHTRPAPGQHVHEAVVIERLLPLLPDAAGPYVTEDGDLLIEAVLAVRDGGWPSHTEQEAAGVIVDFWTLSAYLPRLLNRAGHLPEVRLAVIDGILAATERAR